MSHLCLFGHSGAGKTCFIYAMSQLLGTKGVSSNDMHFTLKANSIQQQKVLNDGYLTLLDNHWPQPTNIPTKYDYCLRLKHAGKLMDILPNLIVQDYRGGILDFGNEKDVSAYEKMVKSFSDSVAIVYVIDAYTLRSALGAQDYVFDRAHGKNLVYSTQQISIIDNLFIDFRHKHKNIPPVLIAISKADILTQLETTNGKRLIRDLLPSIFGCGCNTIGAITYFSIGRDLRTGLSYDKLSLDVDRNIHIPVMFGAYAEFCNQYEEAPEGAKRALLKIMSEMRNIFRGRLDIYINGEKAKEV